MERFRRVGRVLLVVIVAVAAGWIVSWALGRVLPGWLTWTVTFVVVVSIALIAVRRRARPTQDAELSASDAYSDLQLGRRPATPPPHETGTTSQLGHPNPRDPLTLPPREDRP